MQRVLNFARLFLPGVFLALLLGTAQAQVKVTFIHTNDLHARVEPSTWQGEQYGGYARLSTLIKQVRSESINPVLLDAGDVFQGTLYFNVYEGMADLAFMNYIGYDAMVIGNHEFDKGPPPLARFIERANFPVLGANLNLEDEPSLRDIVDKSTVIEIDGHRIGLVGVVLPNLHDIANPGPTVSQFDMFEATQEEVDSLREDGINIIVLLTHVGLSNDLALAEQIDGVDLIIGGHSHSVLGELQLHEFLSGSNPYPIVIEKEDGTKTLIVQAWEWGKVLGRIEVEFDEEGNVASWSNSGPIPVDSTIPEDPVVATMIEAFRIPIAALSLQVLGYVPEDIPTSRGDDNPVGSIIADGMLAATRQYGSVVALMNAGGVRQALSAGDLTYGDAIAVQPFANTLVVLDLKGSELLAALEHGFAEPGGTGGMLIPSEGSRYTVHRSAEAGSRITDVVIAGELLDLEATYRVTLNSFTAAGGDAHRVIAEAQGERIDTGFLDMDALMDHLKTMDEIRRPPEVRIEIFRGLLRLAS